MDINNIDIKKVQVDQDESVMRALVTDKKSQSYVIAPLKYSDFNKDNVKIVIDKLQKNNDNLISNIENMNESIKLLFPYLDKYLDKNNKVIDSSTEWVDDDDEISVELIRVMVKCLKITNAEICVDKDEKHFLIYENKIYSYNIDMFFLENIINTEKLDIKHLYGNRIYKKIINLKNESTDDVLIPCSDSINNKDSSNKIDALRSLCDMLKNANSETSDADPDTDNQTTQINNENTSTGNMNTQNQNDIDNNEADINDLRAKIAQAQEDMSDSNTNYESRNSSYEPKEEKTSQTSEQMQALFFHFLTHPQALTNTLDQINGTIDNFTENLNPNTIFKKKRPFSIRKVFTNVNLVLKYIEMLKIIEMKYKQTLEFRCQSDDFNIKIEGRYFNEHIRKTWDMITLILSELSALKLYDFVSSVPQCHIRFDTNSLFTRDQVGYKDGLELIGLAESNNEIDTTKIVLKREYSYKILKGTLIESQRSIVDAIRKVLHSKYIYFKNALDCVCSCDSDEEDNINNLFNTVYLAGIDFDNGYVNSLDNISDPTNNPTNNDAITNLNTALNATNISANEFKDIILAAKEIFVEIYKITNEIYKNNVTQLNNDLDGNNDIENDSYNYIAEIIIN